MFLLVCVSIAYSPEESIPTARITQDEALRIADSDLAQRLPDYNGIVGIMDPSWSRYFPVAEFDEKQLELPVIYVHPNGTLLLVTDSGYEKRGECNSGLPAYCGWYDKYDFDYGSRLVYAVELQVESQHPLAMYMVDATNGRIVDSSFLRSDWISANTELS
jgi:hypothetical protein